MIGWRWSSTHSYTSTSRLPSSPEAITGAASAIMMPDGVRAFVALKLAPAVEAAIADFIASLRATSDDRSDGVLWTSRQKLHLTVRFLGDRVAASTLERFAGALEEIADASANFDIRVRGLGAFPDLSRPRVIWVALESRELTELADHVERAAVGAGFAAEQRAFLPHLTIARMRNLTGWSALRREIEAARDRDFGSTVAQSLILFRSILGESSSYQELAQYRFGRGT
ncbi:MAG TPA: RNA 2',3'-cyclic phosphodiesterase [Candidatus Binataceae bacterium]